MRAESVARVLAKIAETASETLELQDVFDRVAGCVRELIPFDSMGIVRILDDGRAVLHATSGPRASPAAAGLELPLTAWSPRWRPRPGPYPRIEDARADLDPTFPMDAEAVEGGVESVLWEPFRSTSSFVGGVWLCADSRNAFREEHQELLRPVAALLGVAVEHWRIWDAERRSRERLDRLDEALEILATSLDLEKVLRLASEAIQPVLAHDLLALTELDGSRRFRVIAFAGKPDIDAPTEAVPLTPEELDLFRSKAYLVRDLRTEKVPDTPRSRILNATGMRAYLRVPVRLWGEVQGALGIGHREPSRFGPDDIELLRRVADRLAVVLSHSRLAEEARAVEQEKERAERLEATVETLTTQLENQRQSRIVGNSGPWKEVMLQAGRVAATDTTVLITGESGTGKEVISRLIHQGSQRAKRSFVAINCAALPEQLLESELFGYERGAFTGAVATKIGRIEQASGGTLFLDEIAEMSALLQAKLLRVLQEREFQRLGGGRTLKADVRVIAATNRDLAAAIRQGQFREDLYYRLNVFEIPVPALRERPEDILPLAEAFLSELSGKVGRPGVRLSRDAREFLLEQPWPGNVRELRNAIERAILLCNGSLITRENFPAPAPGPRFVLTTEGLKASLDGSGPLPAGGVDLEAVEKKFVAKALGQARGNKSRAARLLGLTRAQFYSRLEKYGIGRRRRSDPEH
ncbi:MAG TPA: sigma 54-interacting transcriptional regulator [Thermoanaerobaculia bacterium]|nr:sigma 54-interacting transcriptional regulator [Thermoanaerobaculia bacterium]